MDMPGPVDRPVNRILCVHPDGRVTVFADQVYVAFSMEYIDGKLYVHHCPRFSVFVDGGDASAGRTDLIATTNPAPWGSSSRGKNQINDHIPAGFQLAMDGYLYIAVGDKGIHGFVGRDGRRLELPLGGVIRMRPDGTGAEVYATGFRTVLNPAIDARDEIFLYDNNDHLNIYKTAVGHIVDGGYYGYPWDTRPPRPAYVLPMDVRIYEAGAPTGVLAYEEDALPEGYRGNLFLCDWGRGELVRLGLERRGAGYRTVSEEKLLAGNVRPTGIAVAPDGLSFYVGDWQFPGWRSDAKAGRLLKLTYRGASAAAPKPAWYLPAAMGREFRASTDELVRGLSHPARSVRMVAQRRLAERGKEAVPPLVKLLGDPECATARPLARDLDPRRHRRRGRRPGRHPRRRGRPRRLGPGPGHPTARDPPRGRSPRPPPRPGRGRRCGRSLPGRDRAWAASARPGPCRPSASGSAMTTGSSGTRPSRP